MNDPRKFMETMYKKNDAQSASGNRVEIYALIEIITITLHREHRAQQCEGEL